MHLIRGATITVSNISHADLYQDWLDYDTVESGTVDQDLADSWGAPQSEGARYKVLQPASGAPVYLRFVEQDAPTDYQPLRTYGWAAIEICTQDTLAVNTRMAQSPFEIIGPPKQLDGMPAIFPMQVKGPDQEIVYLTEIRDNMPEYDLPRAGSLIDKLFILVMACPDMEAEGAWLEEHLKISKGRTLAINYTMINKAFGLPDGTQHKLATLKHERDVFLEIDEYPEEATARSIADGHLPPCVAIGSFIHPEFDAIAELNADHWITPPTARIGTIYKGKRAATLRSPGGTLIEMIEA